LRTAAAPAPNVIDTVADVPTKNVKIIISGAKVVLRGPVKSAQQGASTRAARATADVTDVDNQLEVKQ
jgi:osmotically-inducible protein OsmY